MAIQQDQAKLKHSLLVILANGERVGEHSQPAAARVTQVKAAIMDKMLMQNKQ